ncbi:hypothetical protein HDU76_013250 [Blyttiomyces sp. JEL0837]|nr:hypothetical protein HDU76_013250 [Blyttiomyces sp. JEL0837]
MHFNTIAISTAAFIAASSMNGVEAFTDGRMLPSYFCAPPNGNMPYSLGGVLKRTVFNMDIPLAFDNNAKNNIAPQPIQSNVTDAAGNVIPNTAFMLASIHSSANTVAPLQNAISMTAAKAGTVLTPGQPFLMTANTGDPNVALDGILIFADNTNLNRTGTFTDAGGKMAPFPACGTDAAGAPMGMVHMELLSDANTYEGISFVPPATAAMGSQIAVHGLAVTDNGFGFWCQVLTVGSANNTPCTVTPATGVVDFAGAAAKAGMGVTNGVNPPAAPTTTAKKPTATATKTKATKTKATKTAAKATAPAQAAAANLVDPDRRRR